MAHDFCPMGPLLPYIICIDNKVWVYQEWALQLLQQQKLFQFREFFYSQLFLIFKHFSVSRIKQIQIFKDMSIDQSEH